MENQQQQQSAEEDEHPNSALINTFIEITCSSKPEALFFLESHNFDLDAAVSTFLESSTAAADINPNPSASSAAAAAVNQSPVRSRSPSYSPVLSESSSHSRSRSPSPHRSRPAAQYNLRSARGKAPSGSGASGAAGRRGGGGSIRTLADLNRRSNDDDGSDTDPDYEPQEYYTGGEKSGMLVQDPSKEKDKNPDAIFSDARQWGVGEGSGEAHPPNSTSKSFSGTARLLSGDTVLPTPQAPEDRTHNITFWNNGFTVNDGPLRRFDDPENASFLESIRRSECPKELEPTDKRRSVHVSLARKEENCPVVEKSRASSFQGVGRTLGSTSNVTSATEPTAADTSLTTAPPPSAGLVVDDTLPVTSIQLRLGDGTRMVSRFNYHHTIRDIRGFINASRPGGPVTYQLQTVGFPPKQLIDLDQTVEQAGLANSVVIQKLS